jgi:glycosyltransferase involved in cell wall biosynthesis
MPSVIIPACNEASVIGRCVDALLQGAPGIEVVVVCNGCTDDTALVAREQGVGNVTVVETPVGSKIAALNLGDGIATKFPALLRRR